MVINRKNIILLPYLFIISSSCQLTSSKEEDKLQYKRRLTTVVDSMEKSYNNEKNIEDGKNRQEDENIMQSGAPANSSSSSNSTSVPENIQMTDHRTTFSDETDVTRYLAGKTFYSKDRKVRVSISDVVTINGREACFNLTFFILSPNLALVTGRSMIIDHPNDIIRIQIHPNEGSIDIMGDYLYLNP